jgi:hypothetical protein
MSPSQSRGTWAAMWTEIQVAIGDHEGYEHPLGYPIWYQFSSWHWVWDQAGCGPVSRIEGGGIDGLCGPHSMERSNSIILREGGDRSHSDLWGRDIQEFQGLYLSTLSLAFIGPSLLVGPKLLQAMQCPRTGPEWTLHWPTHRT